MSDAASQPASAGTIIDSDPSDGSEPPLFELWWVKIPDEVPALIAGHDETLPALYETLMRG